MSDSMDPDAAPAVPVQTMAYHDDAASVAPWVGVVKTLGVLGIVAGSAMLGQVILNLMPLLGSRKLLSFPVGGGTALLAAVPAGLLLAGGIGCVTLRPFGRVALMAYAFAAFALAAISTAANVSSFLSSLGSQRTGFVLYFALGAVYGVLFPALTLVLMRQEPVRRIFHGR